MRIIQNNPFRIIGVQSNITEKELQKQKSKATKYASVGKKIESSLDFPFLNAIDRSENALKRAFSVIEQNNDKLSNALFWFSISNSFDGAAISYLSKGDKIKAIKIWEKVTRGKGITEKNISCHNNLGTIMLIGDSLAEIKIGVELKTRLIESAYLRDFVRTVTDETFLPDSEKLSLKFVDLVRDEFSQFYTNQEIVSLFENCSISVQKIVSKKITEEPLLKIENQIELTRNKRKNASTISASLGLNLYSNCKDEISNIKSLLGQNDLTYMMVADNLAKEILQCGIDYFVDKEEDEAYVDQTISILEKAKSICVNQSTLDRIVENINELKDIKFAEIQYIIEVVRSIKDAVNNLEKENRGKSFYEQQTINKQKVDEILNKEVSSIRIQKLIESKNKTYIDEFIALSTFVRDKLSTAGIKRIIDLLVKTLPNNHEFIILERARQKRLEDDASRRKADEEARKKRDAEREIERKRKEAEENQRQWIILLGVIGVILLIAGSIWGWDGVIGVIVIGVLIMIGGGSR